MSIPTDTPTPIPITNKPISMRQIGPFAVTSIGLGCMNLSHAYGSPPSEKAGTKLLYEAFDRGINFFDTAALYGLGHNETLFGDGFLKTHRQKIVLASKGGVGPAEGRRVIDSRPESIRRDCEGSLTRLKTDVIDLYYLHRWDKKVPIEDVVGTLADLVQEGKVQKIGLSEVSGQTIRQAHAVHPISAVQTEYSLWTRNPEIGVLPTCRELNIAFVAFSPVGRGYFNSALLDIANFAEKDIRRGMPRFQPANFAKNMLFFEALQKVCKLQNCSMAQLSLAWLLQLGQDIIPIPGTTSIAHLQENIDADHIQLLPETLAALNHVLETIPVHGSRYNEVSQSEVDTEQYPV